MRAAHFLPIVLLAISADAAPKKPANGDKPWPMPIVLDASAKPIKDQRGNSCGTGLGFAGSLLESDHGDKLSDWLFVKDRAATAKIFREAGVTFVRVMGANSRWQVGMTWAKASEDDRAAMRKAYKSTPLVDPTACFSFWKENGVKALLCLTSKNVWADPVRAVPAESLEDVAKTTGAFVKWIVDNGCTDTVAGFEMDNEPFWGKEPEAYAKRWQAIIPEIKRHWPEARIGLPIAEYKSNDPDIAAVRARMTGAGQAMKSVERVNEWSGRAIVALGDRLADISHVIYHFYGANPSWGCTPSGFDRIRRFGKVFPEVADKRVWITEFRERSDEDNRCQQTFFSSLWKGHYLLEVLCQSEIDGAMLHHLGAQGGALNTAVGGRWWIGLQPDGTEFPDPDYAGRPRIEVGPCGPVFAIYNDALKAHPVVLAHGTANDGAEASYWHGSIYYDSMGAYVRALAKKTPKEKLPYVKGKTVEWVATLSPKKDSLALLMVNTKDAEVEIPVEIRGRQFAGKPQVRSVTCPAEHIHSHLIPGEKPLWTVSERTDANASGNKMSFRVGPNTVQSVTVPLR